MSAAEVKLGLPGDEEAILELLRLNHAENGIGEFDADKTRATLQRGLRRDWAVVGVIRGKREIEASIGLFVGSAWDSSDEHLHDLWAIVLPAYRKSENAKLLLGFAKMAATKLQRPLIMSTMLNAQTERKSALYERQFGRPAGALFVFKDTAPLAA